MKKSLFAVLALALIVSAMNATPGLAKVVQTETLTATKTVQRWESTPRDGVVRVRVFLVGKSEFGKPVEVPQRLWHQCGANYQARGLIVVLRSQKCGQPGRYPFVLRYVSLRGPLKFRVRLSVQAG